MKLTKEQAAIVGLYTGFCAGPFSDVHALAEKLLGHPIWTHQFADKNMKEKLEALAKPLFIEICYEEKS